MLDVGCFSISAFQMLAKFGRRHAGVVPEKVAEIKFARKAQLRRDVLDREPLVGQQQPRLVEPRPLDVFVDGALARNCGTGRASRNS